MTNLEKWEFLTKDLGCPKNYLTFCFYAGVSAALERRVFYGDLNRPLFCNNYTLLVGPAGVGKGQSMREVKRILAALPAVTKDGTPRIDKKTLRPIPLFNSLADTMTFEAVIEEMAKTRKSIERPNNEGIYESSPFYVCLEELSSLLRINKTDDVARLLLNLYDSSEPYRYKTKKAGDHEIRSGCLNLIAGTTIDFLAKAEQNGLIGEGLVSRMLIVYADSRPEDKFEQNVLTEEQLKVQNDLQRYFFKLGHIFGPLTYTAEDKEFLEDWWKREQIHLSLYADEKLANFFSRRKVQVMKLAAAIEFSEHISFTVTRESFVKAAGLIRDLEPAILRLARRTGRNVYYSATERFISQLTKVKEMSHAEVLQWLSSDLEPSVALNTIAMLKEAGRITLTNRNTWTTQATNSTPALQPSSTTTPTPQPSPEFQFQTAPLPPEMLPSTSESEASKTLLQEYLPTDPV